MPKESYKVALEKQDLTLTFLSSSHQFTSKIHLGKLQKHRLDNKAHYTSASCFRFVGFPTIMKNSELNKRMKELSEKSS